MEFVQRTKGYSDKEEEDDDEVEEMDNFACDFFPRRGQMQWLEGSHQSSQDLEISRSYSQHQTPTTPETINFQGKLQLMDLSLRIHSNGSEGGGGSTSFIEREHMFDKVVTPSDVGKLNRLVIPKQHAEKYFPLDSKTNEKDLILNFEDRNRKPWRFRYSYWNSSQSYVMTKGWSRFVKDKTLEAGDIVSFERGVGEFGKDRLYIDWRRRPDAPPPNHFTNLHQVPNPLLLLPQSVRWGGRHYTIPPPPSVLVPPPRRGHHHQQYWHQHMNYNNMNQNYRYDMANLGTGNSLYYLRPSMASHRMGKSHQDCHEHQGSSMVIESVPVIFDGGNKTSTKTSTAKRLRLFGVNMECPATDEEPEGEEEEDLPNVVIPIETDQISRRGKEPLSIRWDSA